MPLRSRKEKIFKYPQRNIGELDLRDARNRLNISDIVQPVIIYNATPITGARFYKSRANVAAVAAQNQSIAFFGIGIPTFLDRIEVFVSVAGAVRIVAGESITPSAWTQSSLGVDNDMNRAAPTVPRAFIGTNQNFSPSGRIIRRHPSLAINTPWLIDNLQLQEKLAVNAAAISADALVVEAETVNTTIDVNFEWREVP